MKFNPTMPLVVTLATLLIGCGQRDSTGPVMNAAPTTQAAVGVPATATSTTGSTPESTSIVTVDRLEASEDLWATNGGDWEAIEEVEWYPSIADASAQADLVVLGRIVDVQVGRLVDLVPTLPVARVQFVDYIIDVEQISGSSTQRVSFELPIAVSSPELKAAVERASNPVDSNGNGVLDDQELADGSDEEAVIAAYDEFWDQAVAYTIAVLRESSPDNQTLFFLRELSAGQITLVNGDAVIVNDAGLALDARRVGANPANYPIMTEVNGKPFDEMVRRAFAARK